MRGDVTDAELVRASQAGRVESLAALLERHRAGMLATAIVLDPSFNVGVATAVARFLAGFAGLAHGEWPELSIIGVGYAADELHEVMAARATT